MKHLMLACIFLLIVNAFASPRILHDGEKKANKTFTVAKNGTLDVSVNGGDIRIQTWDKNEVNVRYDPEDYEEDSDLKIRQQGNTIYVNDNGSWGAGGLFEISVPVQFNLKLQTSYGDLIVRGKLIGNIYGETSGGDIRLADVDGAVDGRTSGGDIRAGKITGTTSLTTSGGDIEIASSQDELDVKTSGGNINVGDVGKALRARTAGGDIVIGNVGGEANASTAGGNVRVGKVSGRVTLSTAGGDIELSGGNGSIKASTSGGNVSLTNISGLVSASTSGGDIVAELAPSGKVKSRLSSAMGLIKLYLPENAKATITAHIRIEGRWRAQKDDYRVISDFKEESSLRHEDEQEIESTYKLNGGGEIITLETVNSDIEIRKLKKQPTD
ncbi:MAG: DUF4097 family beta strand repeat protein [Ignavibacteriae bacterium]|nr:DUF4097 family beta strand repeat protein [Ignavibacteriota bacterium]